MLSQISELKQVNNRQILKKIIENFIYFYIFLYTFLNTYENFLLLWSHSFLYIFKHCANSDENKIYLFININKFHEKPH